MIYAPFLPIALGLSKVVQKKCRALAVEVEVIERVGETNAVVTIPAYFNDA